MAQEWPQTFMFDPIKVGQLWGGNNGPLGLQAAHDSIHQQDIGQSLSHVLRILKWQQINHLLKKIQCGTLMQEELKNENSENWITCQKINQSNHL